MIKDASHRPEGRWLEKARQIVKVDHYHAVLDELKQPTRDVLLLLAATGWHLTEVKRFVSDGQVHPVKGPKFKAVLFTPRKRSGFTEFFRTGLVDDEQVEAAKRLHAFRRCKDWWPRDMLKQLRQGIADANAKRSSEDQIPPFSFGQMRHSVVMWMLERGASSSQVAAFFGFEQRPERFFFHIDPFEEP